MFNLSKLWGSLQACPPLFIKMFVPTFDNDVSVLVNHSFDLAEIVRFDALLFCENKLRAVPLKLGHATITLHMDVQR